MNKTPTDKNTRTKNTSIAARPGDARRRVLRELFIVFLWMTIPVCFFVFFVLKSFADAMNGAACQQQPGTDVCPAFPTWYIGVAFLLYVVVAATITAVTRSKSNNTKNHPSDTPENDSILEQVNNEKKTWGLICLISPPVILVATTLIYTAISMAIKLSRVSIPGFVEALYIIPLFFIGLTAVLAWLPGIALGVTLLSSRQKNPPRT